MPPYHEPLTNMAYQSNLNSVLQICLCYKSFWYFSQTSTYAVHTAGFVTFSCIISVINNIGKSIISHYQWQASLAFKLHCHLRWHCWAGAALQSLVILQTGFDTTGAPFLAKWPPSAGKTSIAIIFLLKHHIQWWNFLRWT